MDCFCEQIRVSWKITSTVTVKPVLSSHSKEDTKYVFKTNNRLMQVTSIAEVEHSVILSTCSKLPPVFKTFGLSIFECPIKTGFTVGILDSCQCSI